MYQLCDYEMIKRQVRFWLFSVSIGVSIISGVLDSESVWRKKVGGTDGVYILPWALEIKSERKGESVNVIFYALKGGVRWK